jgi:hypothetical protein
MSQMKVRDSKKREGMDSSGEAVCYQLRRYKCKRCGKMHTEQPSDLAPGMRYEADAIQAALDDGTGSAQESACAAEGSTIRRWRGAYMARLVEAGGQLVAELRAAGGRWLAAALMEIFNGGPKHTLNAYAHQGRAV